MLSLAGYCWALALSHTLQQNAILSVAWSPFYPALRLQVGGKDYIMICSRGLHEFFIAQSKAKMDSPHGSHDVFQF
jgi:hypothetical protein